MRNRVLLLSTFAMFAGAALHAQTCSQPSLCSQGATVSLDYGEYLDQVASEFTSEGVSLTFSFTVGGGTLPPGLTLAPNGLLSGVLTQAGTFTFTLNFTVTLTYQGETVFTETVPFPQDFVVTPYGGSKTAAVNPTGLSFSLTQGGSAKMQSVTISNFSTLAATFSASASTNSGGNWLSVSPATGSAASFGSGSIVVSADPSHLSPGTYSGTVSITLGSQQTAVSVVAVVTSNQPTLEISQTGLTFEAVVGGGVTGAGTISVVNTGGGTLNYSASASTTSGSNWLSVSPSSGSATAANAGSVTVSVNPAGLAIGTYYGKIQFSASGTPSQTATVVLSVVSSANSPGATAMPSGLIFVGSAGGTNPSSKTVTISNPSPNALSYLTTAFANTSSSGASNVPVWFSATPPSGTVSANQPATVSIQPNLTGLAAGVYTGDLTVTLTTTTSVMPQTLHVEVLLLVLPAGISLPGQVTSKIAHPQAAGACTPTQLLPVFTLLGTGFSATAGWPTAIEVTVIDDCGTPLNTGSVTLTFSSGDPALALASIGGGHWTGTWNATHSTSNVTIGAQAQETQPALSGKAQIGGTLQTNTATPIVSTGGVVSAASFTGNQPLAPGAYIAIFGSNLSQNVNTSNQLPFNNQLGDTFVVLAGEQLPLQIASSGQINAVVPYDIPVNTTQQLVVQNGNAISVPQPVVIASAAPGIFTQLGTSAAVTNVYKGDGTPLANNSPVSGGYVIVLYCSGLGAVDQTVTAGTAAPSSPPAQTVTQATVTIGGMNATVLFSGLTPEFAQLYQVNVIVPDGLPSGSANVVVSVSGQSSTPATITIQ